MKLFDDERGDLEHIELVPKEICPDNTKEKILYTLKKTKKVKSPGPDELPIDILKIIEERNRHLGETL